MGKFQVEVKIGMTKEFEPNIIGFLCNWCSYAGADLAGTSRMKYPPNIKSIRVMCSGRVDPVFVLEALRKGADGVLIGGCHPGDCHYQSGNYKANRRMKLLKKLLEDLAIDPGRLRFEYISASEGNKFASVVTEFVDELKKMGPNPLKEVKEVKV
jgi:F420-non-reducing hydrogenase iron-sulfur subunit